VTPRSWEHWIDRYERAGHADYALAWALEHAGQRSAA
jgi:hypothetical protein